MKILFTFQQNLLAFPEFLNDECHLPRDHYWLYFGDLKKRNCFYDIIILWPR